MSRTHTNDGGASARTWELCDPFLSALDISGASVSIMTGSGGRSSRCASDLVAAQIDELQFDLGEGPQWAAFRSGAFVAVSDIARGGNEDWPVFGAEVSALQVGAVFAVPMNMGAVTIGVASLYRDTAGNLSETQQTSALAIASALSGPALQQAMRSAEHDREPESTMRPGLHREVHQATGMILVQLDTTATVAYAKLQAYAFAHGRTVQSVAHDIVTRTLSFENMI